MFVFIALHQTLTHLKNCAVINIRFQTNIKKYEVTIEGVLFTPRVAISNSLENISCSYLQHDNSSVIRVSERLQLNIIFPLTVEITLDS